VPFIVAFDALVTVGAIQRGETLLVSGSEGAVGRAAAQIAHWRGARVIGLQLSANPSGADDIINTTKEDLNEAVRSLTEGVGVDIALDAVGGDLFEATLRSIRMGGRQISIARGSRPRVEFNLGDFFHNRATLHGVDSSGLSGERVVEILEALRCGFEDGALSAPQTVELPLVQAVDAYEAVTRGAPERQILTFD
jgi:NADPH:quinone reductase-like Zn-dependent oxidoreductase